MAELEEMVGGELGSGSGDVVGPYDVDPFAMTARATTVGVWRPMAARLLGRRRP